MIRSPASARPHRAVEAAAESRSFALSDGGRLGDSACGKSRVPDRAGEEDQRADADAKLGDEPVKRHDSSDEHDRSQKPEGERPRRQMRVTPAPESPQCDRERNGDSRQQDRISSQKAQTCRRQNADNDGKARTTKCGKGCGEYARASGPSSGISSHGFHAVVIVHSGRIGHEGRLPHVANSERRRTFNLYPSETDTPCSNDMLPILPYPGTPCMRPS